MFWILNEKLLDVGLVVSDPIVCSRTAHVAAPHPLKTAIDGKTRGARAHFA